MERRCRYRRGTLLCVHAGERGARTRSAGGSEGGEWASAAWSLDGGAPDCGTPAAGNARARGVSKRAERQPKYPTKSRKVSLGSSSPTVGSRARLGPTMSALLAVARASARRVASHHRRDAAPALRCKPKSPPRKTKRRPRSIHLTTLPNFNKNDRSSRCRRCPRR